MPFDSPVTVHVSVAVVQPMFELFTKTGLEPALFQICTVYKSIVLPLLTGSDQATSTEVGVEELIATVGWSGVEGTVNGVTTVDLDDSELETRTKSELRSHSASIPNE